MSKVQRKQVDMIGEVLAERQLPRAFDLTKICFPEQLEFINDQSDWVTGCCSRRSGKTEVCALDLLNTALNHPRAICLYVTTTRLNAERIIWSKLLNLNEKYELGGTPNISKLSLSFKNGSKIFLAGCKDKNALDNFLGLGLKLVYIDEVQSFRRFISELIDDKLGPTLADFRGKLKLIGTPAPLKSGYFWDTLHSDVWKHHKWTFRNNPFLTKTSGLTHEQILERELKRRGVDVSHPSVRREWFGEWTNDTESLVLHWEAKNHYNSLPALTDYVIGIDIGFNDSDAIAVIGWNKHEKECYLVEEIIHPQQGITELTTQIETVIKKYNPLRVVMDQGGLGKKIAVELRKRYSLPIEAAEKSRKLEFLALLDDALRTAKFKVKRESRFTLDSFLMEWDWDKSTPDKKVIKQDPHSDICDAVLYAYREALHWLSEPAKPTVNPSNKSQWAEHTRKLMDEQLEKQIQREQAEENEADYYALQDLEPKDLTHYFLNKRRG